MSGDRIRGQTDLPLTAEGRKVIKDFALKLPVFDAVFAAPLKRTKETALLLKRKGEPILDASLMDMSYGQFEGQPTEKVIGQINDYIRNRPSEPMPGVSPQTGNPGESFDAYRKRLLRTMSILSGLARENPDKQYAVILNRRSMKTIEG